MCLPCCRSRCTNGVLVAIREISNAEDVDRARVALNAFEVDCGAKCPRAVAKILAAQARWRVVNAPHLVPLVRNDAVFHKGKLLERPVGSRPHQPNPVKSKSSESPSGAPGAPRSVRGWARCRLIRKRPCHIT